MNADCHPYVRVRKGTAAGATTAPIFAPELNTPVANALSFFGNHSAIALTAAGKIRRLAETEGEPGGAEPCGRARHGVRHGGDAPEDDGDRISDLRPVPVDQPADDKETERVRTLECRDDIPVLDLRPPDLRLEKGREYPEHLPVDIIDRGGKKEERADDPPVPSHGRAGPQRRERDF